MLRTAVTPLFKFAYDLSLLLHTVLFSQIDYYALLLCYYVLCEFCIFSGIVLVAMWTRHVLLLLFLFKTCSQIMKTGGWTSSTWRNAWKAFTTIGREIAVSWWPRSGWPSRRRPWPISWMSCDRRMCSVRNSCVRLCTKRSEISYGQ